AAGKRTFRAANFRANVGPRPRLWIRLVARPIWSWSRHPGARLRGSVRNRHHRRQQWRRSFARLGTKCARLSRASGAMVTVPIIAMTNAIARALEPIVKRFALAPASWA